MKTSKEINEKFNFLKPIDYPNLIRLGAKFDGGYVVPINLIKKTDVLISFGYGYDSSLEYDYIKYSNNKVHIYDYSCSFFYLLKLFLKYLKRFLTFRKNLDDVLYHFNNLKKHLYILKKHLLFTTNKMINFQKRKIVSRKSSNSNVYVTNHSAGEIPIFKIDITIREIFDKINYQNVFLKCDIEGSEYYIIDDILEYHNRIDVIVLEFHWVDKNLELFSESIKKLLKHFSIVHIHGNNHKSLVKNINIPEVPEITFIKNKFVNEKKYVKNFPRQNLDNPNNSNIEDLFFNFK